MGRGVLYSKLFNERDVTMLHDIIFLVVGLALLIFGGNLVTDGAVAVAKKMNISGLVIGLTIVAFGSSAPDLAVCLFSTWEAKASLRLAMLSAPASSICCVP